MKTRTAIDLSLTLMQLSCAAAYAWMHAYGWAALNLAMAVWHVSALDSAPARQRRGRP